VEQARTLLRLDSSDPDLARLGQLAYAATALVDDRLGGAVPFDDPTAAPIPDPVTQACVTVLVEAYRRKDAPFGITGAWSADGVAMRVSKDWLDPVLFALQPYVQAWGVA
jgi:hypothetical protein